MASSLTPPSPSPRPAQRLEKSPCDAMPDVHALGSPSRLTVVKAISAARPAAVCSALTPVSRPHKTHTLQVFLFFFSGEGGTRGSGGRKNSRKNHGNDEEVISAVLGNQVIRLRGQEVRLARPLFSFKLGWLVGHDSVLSSSPVKKGEHGLCLPRVTVHSEGLSRSL